MPEPVPPPDADDELVSRVLDGEGTTEEVARVNADPGLSARLAEFRAVAAAVGATPEPTAEIRSSAVLAALDAYDAVGAPVGDVVSLDSAGRGRWRRAAPIAAAAAIVIVALAALPTLLGHHDENGKTTAAAAGATTTEGAKSEVAGDAVSPSSSAPAIPQATAGAAPSGTVNDRAASQSAAAAAPNFGSYATKADLADALRRRLALDALTYSTPPAPFGAVATCAVDQVAADPALGAAQSAGTATVAGTPYTVLVFVAKDGSHQALLVGADSCVPAGSPFAF